MQETMAISYKWQPMEKAVPAGLHPNMTDWQLQGMRAPVKQSDCLYMWIGRHSVPQTSSLADMQQVLLIRMLDVYSSAGITLALYPTELLGSRYHESM
mmetsp:Transcript_37455/g.105767  ORF Transcript_37455/g.105767 Transcript_37455/m.105767 type:complete len:98 (-) Transcript_37455:208-501(-)